MADVISQGFMHIRRRSTTRTTAGQPPPGSYFAELAPLRHGHFVNSQAELEQLLERGTVKVGLIIPHDFGAKLGWEGEGRLPRCY